MSSVDITLKDNKYVWLSLVSFEGMNSKYKHKANIKYANPPFTRASTIYMYIYQRRMISFAEIYLL